ncbi:MAG: hypothetical protein IKB88_02280 [Clostridia bacterium]|nr:hypothetical protein [Clostridia bacterium]
MLKKRSGLLYIKKRTFKEALTLGIFVFPFIMSFLLEFLHFPSLIKYAVDGMYFIAVILVMLERGKIIEKKYAPFAVFTVVFLFYTLFIYLFNFQSPFYYLWGLRNNFRFFAAFFLFAMVFDEEEANGCLRFMDVVFWLNAIVTAFQFFFMGLRQDYLGGLFGVERGCNAYTVIFFAIVLSKSLLNFMLGNEKTGICLLKCGTALLISAMAELKFFFILFVIILAFCTVMTRFSFKKALLIIVAALLLTVSGLLLPIFFGESRALTVENILKTITASNYSSARDLGRFTAIPIISREILTTPLSRLFGMGLGNCDTSSFAICNSSFYQSHAYMNYNWFSSAFLFLETGYVGLMAYLSFFVLVFINAWRRMKKKVSDQLFCRIAMIMSIVCFIMVFYNSSLRTEIAYMAFFSLALPFVNRTKNNVAETESINEEVSV